MLGLILSILGCITFLLLCFFFLFKTFEKESILSTILHNKFTFVVIYGIFTFMIMVNLGLKYDFYDNIFPLWLVFLSLIVIFSFVLLILIYFALKMSANSSLKIFKSPSGKGKNIPDTIVLDDVIQTSTGVTGKVLENVSFIPHTNIVKSYDEPDGDYIPIRRVYIPSNKIHYTRGNVHYLKSSFIRSNDPEYDIEVSLMGFDETDDKEQLVGKVNSLERKYNSAMNNIREIMNAYDQLGVPVKNMVNSMSEGTRHFFEQFNIQKRGKTDWERKQELGHSASDRQHNKTDKRRDSYEEGED